MLFHGRDDALFDLLGPFADAFQEPQLAQADAQRFADGPSRLVAERDGGGDVVALDGLVQLVEQALGVDVGATQGPPAFQGHSQGDDRGGRDDPQGPAAFNQKNQHVVLLRRMLVPLLGGV